MHRIVLLLSAVAVAFAESGPSVPAPGGGGGSAPGGSAPSGGGMWQMLIIFAPLALMMWFMVIRPQKKEEKRRKEMIDATKRGDEVVTIGGVHGTVEAVGEATIDVRVGKGDASVVATFNKGAVSTNLTNERAAQAAKK